MNYIKSNRAEIARYLKAMIEAPRWLYDSKNKEKALAIHQKVLKASRESAEEDYKYLVQDFQPFPRDGTVSKASYDKTMELRAKEGIYQGKKIPPMSEYVDKSLIGEALTSSCLRTRECSLSLTLTVDDDSPLPVETVS